MNGKIFVGVDGGCEEHMCTALDEGGKEIIWQRRIGNTHAGCDQMLEQVREWQGRGYEVWVGAEGIGGYLSPWDVRLMEAGCKYVNLPPLQVKRFRQALFLQMDKEDEKDSLLLARILHLQVESGEARLCEKREDYFQTLKETARAFNNITDSKVRTQNELVNAVRTYWPELVIGRGYFSKTDAVGLLRLLAKYPTPQEVSRAGEARVRTLLSNAMRSDQTELARRLVKQARSLKKHVEVTPGRMRLVRNLAEGVLRLTEAVKELENELKRQLEEHPFGVWLLKQEGIGPRTAGCFLGEAGNLGRFEREEKLSRYAGTGPNKNQSGKSEARHWDGHCYNHRLKRAVLLMAQSRARFHGPSIEFLRERHHTKDDYWKTIKKLARHLVRFLWNNWEEVVKTQSGTGQDSLQEA